MFFRAMFVALAHRMRRELGSDSEISFSRKHKLSFMIGDLREQSFSLVLQIFSALEEGGRGEGLVKLVGVIIHTLRCNNSLYFESP